MFNDIREIEPKPDWSLHVVFADGTDGVFDVKPYLDDDIATS